MVTINKYFFLSGNYGKSVASAFAPQETKLFHELIADLNDVNEFPFELELIKLTIEKNGLSKSKDLSDLTQVWLDYQPNSFARPLFSERFKTIIESRLTGYEGVDWVSVKVNSHSEQRVYYLLRFEKMPDVLDIEKTMFIKETDNIVRPCFSFSKIDKYTVFTKPSSHDLWKIPSALYVNEDLKKIIKIEKLSGIGFESVLVA